MSTSVATRPAPLAVRESTSSGTDRAVEIVSALSSLVRHSRAIARHGHDQLGVASTPLAVLKALSRAEDGQDRPGDLASATGVAPSVVSRVLTRLEHDGLVTRHRDELDARACHITLSIAGRAHLDAVHREYAELLREALSDVPDEDLSRIPQTLAVLAQALGRAAERVATRRHTPAPRARRATATPAPHSTATESQ
jgi:DNA-binding MarR family transcriptional regulator